MINKLINAFLKKIKTGIYLGSGWIIILPISLLFRKIFTKKYILFIGRDKSLFLDNVKYLYLFLYKNPIKNFKIIFLTEDKQTYKFLKNKELPVVFYPSFEAIRTILATKVLIVDHLTWVKNFKGFLLWTVPKIQLWHGIGFKYIELINSNDESIQGLKGFLLLRKPKYKVVISTSKFYTQNVFAKAFRSKEIWETGYPRNDIFFRDINNLDLINVDIDIFNLVKKTKKKVIVYAPTFRDSGGDPIKDKALDLERFNKFLEKKNAILILKFHPDPNFSYPNINSYKNILVYPQNKDIYPILKYADILITDYSSIFMDFLLIDRPIVFYPYDKDKYMSIDRKLQFDYDWITPGVKVYNFNELLKTLEDIISGNDNFKVKREAIRKLAWKYIDGNASFRIKILLEKLLQERG